LAYVSVECGTVYLILLKSYNALVELPLSFRINDIVKRFRIGDVGSMKQKVRGIVNQKLFGRNRLASFRFFSHDFKLQPFILANQTFL